MKAQVNRRAVLRSLRFWVGGLRLRIKGSGSPVRAHPSVAAAVTAGLRRRRQSVLFHPFNLLELACSPIQGTVHRNEARWKGFRRQCWRMIMSFRSGEAKGWWEGGVSARDGGRGMSARGGRKEGHDCKGR